MDGAAFLLAKARDISSQMDLLAKNLRERGVARALLDRSNRPGQFANCIAAVERLIELSEELAESLGVNRTK